jgi:hypothetical protein
MTDCLQHDHHDHQHGPQCGHVAVSHDGHVDYLHDGHLHHVHGNHVDEHVLAVIRDQPRMAARRSTRAPATQPITCTARAAATRRCRTAITSITWWAGTCIIRTAVTATTTGRCPPSDA